MKPPSWDVAQFGDVLGLFEGSQHGAKLSLMLLHNTTHPITAPKPFDILVPKANDAHGAVYGITVRTSI